MIQKQEKSAPQALQNANYFIWSVRQGKKAMHEERVRRIFGTRARQE